MQLSGATGDAAQRDGVVDELELRHERADPGPQAIVVLGVGALDLRTAAAEVGEDGADVLGVDDVDDRLAGEQPGGELGAGALLDARDVPLRHGATDDPLGEDD